MKIGHNTRILSSILAGLCLFTLNCRAEEAATPVTNSAYSVSELETQLSEKWKQVESSIKSKNLKETNSNLNDLEILKLRVGYTEVLPYSQKLMQLSENALASGEKENSKYLARKSLELSSQSPELLLTYSAHLVDIGLFTHFQIFAETMKVGLQRYDFLMGLMLKLIYPVLWSLTFAAIFCSVLLFISHSHIILQNAKRIVPKQGWAISVPLVLSLIMIAPLFGGPIWAMISFIFAIYIFLPRQRVFAACLSIVLVLWAVLVPLRENMYSWIEEPGVRSMLRVYSGVFNSSDLRDLTVLSESRPQDQMLKFLLAKIQRRHGQYEEAARTLQPLRKNSALNPIIDSEVGLIKYLEGDAAKADALYKDLSDKNEGNAKFLYNYSKIRFELLDTEHSRTLFDEANKIDKNLIAGLRDKEDRLGLKNPNTFAEQFLPLEYLFKSATMPEVATKARSDKKAADLIPLITLQEFGMLGTVLLILFLFVSDKRYHAKSTARKEGEYKPVHAINRMISILPTGNSILSGNVNRAFFLASFIALMTMPFMKWPVEFETILGRLAGLELYYVYAYCFLIAATSYVGFSSYEKEKV